MAIGDYLTIDGITVTREELHNTLRRFLTKCETELDDPKTATELTNFIFTAWGDQEQADEMDDDDEDGDDDGS